MTTSSFNASHFSSVALMTPSQNALLDDFEASICRTANLDKSSTGKACDEYTPSMVPVESFLPITSPTSIYVWDVIDHCAAISLTPLLKT